MLPSPIRLELSLLSTCRPRRVSAIMTSPCSFAETPASPTVLKVTWQSEPQLPEADVIALLALGRTQEESAAANLQGGFGFGGDASNLLINQALNSTVNSRLQRFFGVSRVKIDPQGLASDTAVVRGPQVTVEQQVRQ